MRAAAVAGEVYETNRRHPGALHYLIPAYDDPGHALSRQVTMLPKALRGS